MKGETERARERERRINKQIKETNTQEIENYILNFAKRLNLRIESHINSITTSTIARDLIKEII